MYVSLSLYIYIYIYIYIYTHIHIHTYTHIHIHVCVYIYIYREREMLLCICYVLLCLCVPPFSVGLVSCVRVCVCVLCVYSALCVVCFGRRRLNRNGTRGIGRQGIVSTQEELLVPESANKHDPVVRALATQCSGFNP